MADEIYHVEVKRKFRRSDGQNELRWVVRPVADVITEESPEYRCKDCYGKVKLHGKNVADGRAPHAEHRSRQDSEYCPAGTYFRQNPGRTPKLSLNPIE
ncbi:MAG: hypothetical protein DMG98_18060 [Acidobacteria bacterium]|nr:MAG: hypothetical protein DMG98_18060 [Acidobacteriota bacterium]